METPTMKKKAKSNHSGIGKPYFLLHYRQILTLGYVPFGDQKMPVPRSFIKLAHKHYAHYYDTSCFFDTPSRKRLYRPFTESFPPIKEIASLYITFKQKQNELIKELEKEWWETIEKEFDTKEKPDFIKSAENILYDLKQKNQSTIERF